MTAPSSLVIITGSSRGLGEAMAAHYLAAGATVLGLARRQSGALERAAQPAAGANAGTRLEQWLADLADPVPVAERLAAWLAEPARRTGVGYPARLRLIHNAAL